MFWESFHQIPETSTSIALGGLAVCVIAIAIYDSRRVFTKGPSLPPGPPPDPFIGNLRQFPKDHVGEGFSKWAKIYGDIVWATMPGTPMVVINTYNAAQELLTKRPTTTGGRNNAYLFNELMDQGWAVPSIELGATHTEVRKMLRRGIGPQRVGHYDPVIQKGAARLGLRLRTSVGDPHSILVDEVGRLMLMVTYGEEIFNKMGADLAAWNREMVQNSTKAFFNFWLVNVFHFLRFIPEWIPGALFKKMANRTKWLSDQVRFKSFKEAKQLHNTGKLGASIATDLLEEFGPVQNVQDSLAILYLAGSDTTSGAITAFLHAMFLFPEVARKVYKEIEAVTDGGRLPEVKDRAHLPYTEATWKEAFRWNAFMMLGIPHVNTREEVINGFLIPKGTTIHINNRFILMDPRVWGDPQSFRPERFLEPGADCLPNPLTVTFGFGMRVCPGMYLADRLGFHYSATVVALFDVTPLEGARRPDPKTVEYADLPVSLPTGFHCRFVPRNEQLLKSVAMED